MTSPVTFQLRRPPLETSKYLFERHRRELARTSYSCLKKMLRRKVDEMIVKKSESSADRLNLQSRLAFLIELYQSLQKLKKGGVQGKDEGKCHLMKKTYRNVFTSVQAEIFLLPAPTFLEGFYLNFHMPGHFFLYEVVYAYPSGPLARLHKNRTKRL